MSNNTRTICFCLILAVFSNISLSLAATQDNIALPSTDSETLASIKVKKVFNASATGNEFIESAPGAIGSVAYIATRSGKLISVSLNTGQIKWSCDIKQRPVGRVVVTNPMVFVSTFTGDVYAIDRLTGKQKWQYSTNSQLYSAPGPVDPDGCACRGIFRKVTITTGDGDTICLNSRSGEKLWQNDGETRINAPVSQHQNALLIADCDAILRAMDLSSGKNLWQVELGAPIGGSPVITQIDNKVKILLATAEGQMLCVDAEKHTMDWKTTIANGSVIEASPVVVGSIALIGADDSAVHAIDIKTGKEIWQFKADESFADAIIVSTIGIFAADDSGKLYLLDAKSGKKLWSYDAGEIITGLAAIKDGIIFTTTDGILRTCRWQP